MEKTDIQIAEYIANQCEVRNLNICGNFEDWTKVAFALADLGEQGRGIFHRIASISNNYRQRENEMKFTNALRTVSRIKFSTLIYIARQQGISFAGLGKPEKWRRTARKAPQRLEIRRVDYLPIQLVKDAHIGCNTLVIDFLCYYFDLADVLDVCNAYLVRSTLQMETVFPQIDILGRLRTGKIIAYGADGHRIKSRHADWLHARYMKKQGKTAQDFHLRQCLFGEHLLSERPSAQVCIVESEKSAIVCSMAFPNSVWLATGGKMNLSADRCKCLIDRNVILYPDADAVQEWTERSKELTFCRSVKVSDWWKNEPQGSKRDLADVIMKEKEVLV